MRRLGGGLGSATHLLTAGDGQRLVLKRYPAGRDLPALEWECLVFAHRHGLPAPAPLALDQDGDWFGTPSLAISVVPGRPDLAPNDAARYVDDVVDALVRIHTTPTGDASRALRRPHAADTWAPPEDGIPDGLLGPALAGRVVAAITDHIARADRGGAPILNHGDFHPGNLLWRRGRRSGVVDWSHARLGPRWWELAYFRMELGVLTDRRHVARMLRRYEAATGLPSGDQPVWDLVCLYNGHRWGAYWLAGYREQGRRDLTLATMRRRLDRLARRALADLGA